MAYFIVAVFITVGAYILIYPIGHTGDGWGYAADALQANSWNSGELVSAHHLLYHYLCFLLKSIFNSCHIRPIQGFTAMNWIFYGLVLLVFYSMLKGLQHSKTSSFSWTLLMGGCFGVLRFALENETYMIPLFFALCGSFFIINNKPNESKGILGFFLLGLSVLFHQSYIFWLIAFGIFSIKRRKWIGPICSITMIIGIYMLFAIKQNLSLFQFILTDVNQGLVQTIPNLNNVKFTLINGFRTIFQVHGNQLLLFKQKTILSLFGVFGLVLFFVPLLGYVKNRFQLNHRLFQGFKSRLLGISPFQNPFFLAFVLHLAFAFYSVGNAEFMVMLPMLFLLSFHNQIISNSTHIPQMTVGIWIYQIVFFVIPLFSGWFDDIGQTSTLLSKENLQRPFLFVSSNAIAIQNKLEYESYELHLIHSANPSESHQNENQEQHNSRANHSLNTNFSKGHFLIGQNPAEINEITKLLHDPRMEVYTDNTILFNRGLNGSRSGMLTNPLLKKILYSLRWEKAEGYIEHESEYFDQGLSEAVKNGEEQSMPRKGKLYRLKRDEPLNTNP